MYRDTAVNLIRFEKSRILHLIKAIQEGKISRPMARLIIRKLMKKGIPVDPDLMIVVQEQ